MQFFKNPFYIYIFSFSFVIVILELGWSTIYPTLSLSLTIFFILTFIVSLFIGGVIDKYKPIKYFKINDNKNIIIVIIGIYLLFILEFINNRGIPFILALKTDWYDYTKFGIKTLHPILVTFTSFYTVYLFHILISNKSIKNIIYLVLLIIIPILIYNRGMFLINFASFIFVFLMSIKRIKKKTILFFIIGLFLIFYLFGVLGNYRTVKTSSNDYFLKVSSASETFKKSNIPKEFMWSYIYISSPLANMQNTINNNPKINFRIKDFIFTELFPDFISKRISPIVNADRVEKINRLTTFMTVGGIYSRSYILLGWIGPILMFIFIAITVFFYLILLKNNSKYYVTGISILCTFMVYNTFTNMIYFSGVSFQLVFPLLLMYLKKIKIKFKFKK